MSAVTITPEKTKQVKHVGNEKPVIFIGLVTCGLASGGGETYKALTAELARLHVDARIVKVGCIGSCFAEPIVDIKLPGRARVSFQKITADKIPALLKSMIVEGKVPMDLVLGQYPSEDHEPGFDNVMLVGDTPFFKNQRKFLTANCGIVDPLSLDEYVVYNEGYKALANVLRENDPDKLITDIKASGLRGRGGGGFPAGQKWELTRAAPTPDGQRYIICNADEGDPGSFQNRLLLESLPWAEIEGITIAAFAIGASKGIIYVRAEYPLAVKHVDTVIKEAYQKGLLGKNILGSGFNFDLSIKKGAGAFVCGEETAMIASIEGDRGMPKIKPPYPANKGLFGRPTVINNVETLATVPRILTTGVEAFVKIGVKGNSGTKSFSLTGKIARPGMVEVPLGITIGEMVDIGGGIPNGKKLKAVQIGGPSGFCLPRSGNTMVNGTQVKVGLNTAIDYDTLKALGGMMGSGGIVVMDEDTCMVDTARYFMHFITSESCGKCIPCREGTKRLLETIEKLVNKPRTEKEAVERMKSMIYLERLAWVIKDSALCGLGMSAPNPVLSTLQYFRDEYERHLQHLKCDAKYCGGLLTYRIDTSLCTGCGLCKMNCPAECIVGERKTAHFIDETKCIRCGLCFQNCKFEAVLKL
ncbi:MAG: 4Fe-4S binding protein [Candidatus Lokiarchaeota archaeon]|nr:4Fe-4S binding protein [Candidatus Lokiarchaeota archaeon]